MWVIWDLDSISRSNCTKTFREFDNFCDHLWTYQFKLNLNLDCPKSFYQIKVSYYQAKKLFSPSPSLFIHSASLFLSSLTMEWAREESFLLSSFFFFGWLPIKSAFAFTTVINDIWWLGLMKILECAREKWMRSLWDAQKHQPQKKCNVLIKNYLVHHHNLNEANFFYLFKFFDTNNFITKICFTYPTKNNRGRL